MYGEKVIIVEGLSDKKRIEPLIAEPVVILCTNGTVSATRLEELMAPYDGSDLFVFVDADKSGEKLRALFKREYPEAMHLYTEPAYREVATTPVRVLANVLMAANIDIHSEYFV